jgi:uncharacterized protein (TIGR03032 family)
VTAEETAAEAKAAEAKAGEEKPAGEASEAKPAPSPTGAAKPSGTKITCSRGFSAWLRAHDVSIGFTSYQSGRLYLVGRNGAGGVSFHERFFQRAMGLFGSPQRLLLATMFQVWRFENVLNAGEVYRVQERGKPQDYDRHYVPRFATTTGDIDVHEINIMADGRIVFVNTAYSCLALLSQVHSFKPYWKPPFISRLAAEDRCHLNGLAMRDGAPAFVTAVSRSDVVNGWRERRAEGGTIIDVASNEIVTEKLSMPHSPRWHEGALWVLNSGTGHIGRIDGRSGAFEPVAFCPGFLRGLQFHAGHALVGLSLPRDGSFSGLQLDAELKKRDAEPWCGLQVINLGTGDIVQWIRLEGEVTELFDVCVLPGVKRPMSTGILSDDIHRLVTIDRT